MSNHEGFGYAKNPSSEVIPVGFDRGKEKQSRWIFDNTWETNILQCFEKQLTRAKGHQKVKQ